MTHRRHILIAGLGLVAAVAAALAAATATATKPARPPLSHDAYVWQRAWTPPVREAVLSRGTNFSELIALHTEVSWKLRQPEVIRVPLDYAALTGSGTTVGLALRVGPFPGPFQGGDAIADFLCQIAASALAEARSNRLSVRELQVDFDCAESKLAGYREWITAVRRRVTPTPVTITVLPSWLRQRAFAELARATDGFVLQVHSLERPADINAAFTLCDPEAARLAVERAGAFGVPFRVALPTYGYVLAFDSGNRFLGLSAEGPRPNWPADARLREVRADPREMAALVEGWTARRPAGMRGVIWSRLPTIVDNLNWHWPTLGAIVGSHPLRESFRSELRRVEPGLVEINLVNEGELDISTRLTLELRWRQARLVAGDALRGFELVEEDASTAKLQTPMPLRLRPGETRQAGWLRFDKDCEVRIGLKKH